MSEHDEQAAFILWCRQNEDYFPGLWLIHNSLNGVKVSQGQARKMKREGMLAGVCDVFLPQPMKGYHGLYIEFKFGRNWLSESQERFIKAVEDNGYMVAIAKSKDEGIQIILEYYGVEQ